jgi:hypothetical protein
MLTETTPQQGSSCDGTASLCRYRRILVKSYVIAYREALKYGDDPAEYIRDCTKGSRDIIDPKARGGKPQDRYAAVDIKIALEQIRDRDGIEINVWNVDRIAQKLCSAHWDADR